MPAWKSPHTKETRPLLQQIPVLLGPAVTDRLPSLQRAFCLLPWSPFWQAHNSEVVGQLPLARS